MAYKGGKVQKVMVQVGLSFKFLNCSLPRDIAYAFMIVPLSFVSIQPINLIFRYLQNRSRVTVWLYENVNTRVEGHIIGFDEYMNLVMQDAEEVDESHVLYIYIYI